LQTTYEERENVTFKSSRKHLLQIVGLIVTLRYLQFESNGQSKNCAVCMFKASSVWFYIF